MSLLRFLDQHFGLVSAYALGPAVGVGDSYEGSGRRLRPDLLAAYAASETTQGLALDVKWSLPNNRQALVEELTSAVKYRGPLTGWPQPSSTLNPLDVVVLCHQDDAVRARRTLETLLQDDPQAYAYLSEPGYSVWAWGEVVTRQRREVVRISRIWGSLLQTQMESRLSGNIDIPKSQFLVEQGYVQFVGDRPPIVYVALVVLRVAHSYVFGTAQKRLKNVSLDELDRTFTFLFPAVGQGLAPQVSRSMLRQGVEILAEIGYNVRRLTPQDVVNQALDQNQEWYCFERKLPKGDLIEWTCEQLERLEKARAVKARKDAKARRHLKPVRKPRYRVGEKQTRLP